MLRFLIYKLKNSIFFLVSEVKQKRNELSKKSHLVNENEPYNILSCVTELVLALEMLQNFKIEGFSKKLPRCRL